MPRKREVVKINDKEYIVKELTVEEIISIFDGSTFFSDTLKDKPNEKTSSEDGIDDKKENEEIKTLMSEFDDIAADLNRIMETCCNFKAEDLKKLTPSDIRNIYEKFKKVNSDFFVFLEKMGIMEALGNLKDMVVSYFSKTFATSLKLDM